LQQQGLGLIVLMVRGEQAVALLNQRSQGSITRITRRSLGAFTRFWMGIDGQGMTGNPHRRAHCFTMTRPFSGGRLKSVIDVHGVDSNSRQRRPKRGHGVQQDVGIETAAVSDPVAFNRGEMR